MRTNTKGVAVRRSVEAFGALLLASGTAFAADLPSRRAPPVYVPPPIPVSSWTGVYVGVAGGVDFLHNNWTTQQLDTGVIPPDSTANAGFGDTRGRIGGFVGYNYQITSVVVGVEGDGFYDFGRTRSTFGVPGTVTYVTPLTGGADSDSASASSRYDASIRGRLGYLVTPTLLVYATGGAAFRDGTYTLNCPANGASYCGQPEYQRFKTNLVGYTVGGGLEYKLTNTISIRADYRYSDFGHRHLDFFGTPQTNNFGDDLGVDTHQSASTVTVGLAYRFDALAPAPVVARY